MLDNLFLVISGGNVLLDERQMNIKLADFGISTVMDVRALTYFLLFSNTITLFCKDTGCIQVTPLHVLPVYFVHNIFALFALVIFQAKVSCLAFLDSYCGPVIRKVINKIYLVRHFSV